MDYANVSDVRAGFDSFGIVLWVTVGRDFFDKVEAEEPDEYFVSRPYWAKTIRESNVAVIFITYEEAQC